MMVAAVLLARSLSTRAGERLGRGSHTMVMACLT